MDGRYQATALINDTSKYDLLWKHVTNQNELSEYIVFNEQHTPIYLPKDEIKMIQRSFTTESIDSNKLVNALRSEEHTSELQSRFDLVCRLLLEKKKNQAGTTPTSYNIRS